MRKLIGLLAGVTVLGCVSMNTTDLAPNKSFDPVTKNDVQIFQGEDEVPEPYVKLALFHAEGSHSWTDESDLYEKMRKKAAERGCNGVVLQGVKEAGTAEKIFFGSGADREAQAVCVRFGDDVEPASSDADGDQDADAEDERLPVIHLD